MFLLEEEIIIRYIIKPCEISVSKFMRKLKLANSHLISPLKKMDVNGFLKMAKEESPRESLNSLTHYKVGLKDALLI